MRFGHQSQRGGKGDAIVGVLVLIAAIAWMGAKIHAGAWGELIGTAAVLALLFVLIMIASVYIRPSV